MNNKIAERMLIELHTGPRSYGGKETGRGGPRSFTFLCRWIDLNLPRTYRARKIMAHRLPWLVMIAYRIMIWLWSAIPV